jgi:hypothetical protein
MLPVAGGSPSICLAKKVIFLWNAGSTLSVCGAGAEYQLGPSQIKGDWRVPALGGALAKTAWLSRRLPQTVELDCLAGRNGELLKPWR